MNLAGWDTMSAAAMPLVNQGLAKAAASRDAALSYTEGDLTVEGRFGPWRILEGGSLQLLQMAIPIESGTLTGLGPEPQTLDGLELIVEVVLRLLPNEAGDGVELTFSFERLTERAGPAVQVLQVVDPSDRFPFIGNALVQQALNAALNANVAGVAHVLATMPTRGSAAGWLTTPFTDWANVRLGDGRQYLAIFGSLRKPDARMALDKVDPRLFSGNGSAYFAASQTIFNQKLMAPYLTKNFRPRTTFQVYGNGRKVRAKSFRMSSPRKEVERLTVDSLGLAPGSSKLSCAVRAVARLKAANLHLELDMDMPFELKSGKIGFGADRNPRIKHRTAARKDVGVFKKTLGFAVTALVIEIARKSVYDMVRGIATRMQNINAPARMPASFIGIRDFEPSSAKLRTCFWFRDDRPV